MVSTQLSTPRLLLREARIEDIEQFYTFFSDEEVMRYWSTPPHQNTARTEKFLNSMMTSPSNGKRDFAIVHKEDNRVIGKIGIWNLEVSEIGFMLHRQYWGKGLAVEAMNALLPHLWTVEKVEYITADVDPRNKASLGLLKKIGFRETGFEEKTFEVEEGVWVDSVYLRLDRPQTEAALSD